MFPRPLLPLPVHHHATSLLSQAPPLLLQQREDDDVELQPELEQPYQQHQEQRQHTEHSEFVGGDAWTQSQQVGKEAQRRKGGWTSEMIENERRRGMELVRAGDLDDSECDFCEEVEVLGRHFDI